MKQEFEMKDTGKKRREFKTGATRDNADNKPMLSLISPIFSKRLGMWLTNGAKKYSPRNWEKGFPLGDILDSLERHIADFKEGMVDEDHLAAAACNIMFLIHTEEMIRRGILPKELNDIPNYLPIKKKVKKK